QLRRVPTLGHDLDLTLVADSAGRDVYRAACAHGLDALYALLPQRLFRLRELRRRRWGRGRARVAFNLFLIQHEAEGDHATRFRRLAVDDERLEDPLLRGISVSLLQERVA